MLACKCLVGEQSRFDRHLIYNEIDVGHQFVMFYRQWNAVIQIMEHLLEHTSVP